MKHSQKPILKLKGKSVQKVALPLQLGQVQQDSSDINRKACNTAFTRANSEALRLAAPTKAVSNKEASSKEAPAQLGHGQDDSNDINRKAYNKAFSKSFSEAF